MSKTNFIIYHVGARDNYLLAETILQKNNQTFLFTDYWLYKNSILNFFNKNSFRRINHQIDENNVQAYALFQILYIEIKKRFIKNKFQLWNFLGYNFQKFVLKNIKINSNDKFVFFGFTGGNFQILKEFKEKSNLIFIHNQFDPGLVYYDIDESPNDKHKDLFLKNIQKEWDLSDLIIVNSQYSKNCLIEKGVSSQKIKIVPLAYNKPINEFEKINNKKLKIAFIGNINKVKGFETYLEVAKLTSDSYEFVAIGNVYIKENIVQDAKTHISFLGFLNKDDLEEYYKQIDVLIFPTLCDGFGMVQLEAMANGIPVIASEFCAKIVDDNKSGFIVNSSKEIVEKLSILNNDRELLSKFSKNSFQTAKEYNIENYISNLNNALSELNIVI